MALRPQAHPDHKSELESVNDVSVEIKLVQCKMCTAHAIAHYAMPGGETLLPNEREMDLCIQHAIKCEPLDGMEAILIYDPDAYRAFLREYHLSEKTLGVG